MRWLTGLVMVLGCLWGGYWFLGERTFETGARGWFTTLQQDGKIATNSGLAVHGFPNRFDLTVTDAHFADPATGFDWQLPFFQVLSLSYKPWHVIVAFPPEQRLALPPVAMTLQTTKMQASVIAKPQPALPLDRLTLIAEALALTGDAGWQVAAETLQFATRLDESRSNWHDIGLNIANLTPDRSVSALTNGLLPEQLAVIRLDAHVGLTGPIDQGVLVSKPLISAVELDNLHLEWGPLRITAKGSVVADAKGLAQGSAVLELENWRLALELAEKAGLLPDGQRPLWEQAAAFLAQPASGDDAIALPLTFQNGQTAIGPLIISSAPRLR
jgi:hypothetical protein